MEELRVLQLIAYDEEWALRVVNFVDTHKEFRPYLRIAPLTRLPLKEPDDPKNVFEQILHCMCSAGVRADYGHELFLKVREHLIRYYPSTEFSFHVANNKLEYFRSLINKIYECRILPEQLDYNLFKSLNFSSVHGVGETTVSIIYMMYGNDFSILPFTDRTFLSGMKKLYGDLPVKQYREISEFWTDRNVAVGMIRGIHYYG